MSILRPGDYGYRRKRNVDLNGKMERDQESRDEFVSGINWGSEKSPEPQKGEETIIVTDGAIEIKKDTPLDYVLIGNRKLNVAKFQSKEKIEETEKITIYLPKDLISILKVLKKSKTIESYSKCIRQALEQFMA